MLLVTGRSSRKGTHRQYKCKRLTGKWVVLVITKLASASHGKPTFPNCLLLPFLNPFLTPSCFRHDPFRHFVTLIPTITEQNPPHTPYIPVKSLLSSTSPPSPIPSAPQHPASPHTHRTRPTPPLPWAPHSRRRRANKRISIRKTSEDKKATG